MIEYTLTVTNTGNITNTFAITYTGNVWGVDLMKNSLELGVGESAELVVQVTIPAEAANGAVDTVTIEASGEGEAMAASELTTTALIGELKIFLPLALSSHLP
jgi:hypothetical protein